MDSNLLFDISLTLNDIRDSISSSGGIKPYIPSLFAVCGIILGFSLTLTKEAWTEKKKIKKFKKCIYTEVGVLKKETGKGLVHIIKYQERLRLDAIIEPLHSYNAASYVCFEKFFHEIVGSISEIEFTQITGVYNSAKTLDDCAYELLGDKSSLGRDELIRQVNILMSNFLHVYSRCDALMTKQQYEGVPDFLKIKTELNINSWFYDDLELRNIS